MLLHLVLASGLNECTPLSVLIFVSFFWINNGPGQSLALRYAPMQREVGELVRGFGKHLELIADVIDHDRAADAATEAARVRAFSTKTQLRTYIHPK